MVVAVQDHLGAGLRDHRAEGGGIDQPLAPHHLVETRRMMQQHDAEAALLAEAPQQRRQALQLSDAEGAVGAEQRRSEEHTSELQSLMRNSYAVFCLKKKQKI